MLIVPADPLRPRRPDEHFAAEAEAARAAGLEVAVVDHDALARARRRAAGGRRGPGQPARRSTAAGCCAASGTPRSPRRSPRAAWCCGPAPSSTGGPTSCPAGTRRWRRVTPRVGVDGRRRPGRLRPVRAPRSGAGPGGAARLHQVDEALLARGGLHPRARRRGGRVDGGEPVPGAARRRLHRRVRAAPLRAVRLAEVRTWWVNGGCLLVGPHPDTPDDCPPAELDLAAVAPLVAALGLPFVTVDLALRADGAWRVIELGDGQVSDRPPPSSPKR